MARIAPWLCLGLALACLAVWSAMPIYPDEIALRQHLGRIIPDQGIVQGLYALCSSNARPVPTLLLPAAWLTSGLSQMLSPPALRPLPMLLVAGVVLGAAWLAARGRNPWAGLLGLAGFAGVAGSGLVMARHEAALEVQVLVCLSVLAALQRPAMADRTRWAGLAALALAASLSVYIHVQGLLFLPLALLMGHRLLAPSIGWRWSLGVLFVAGAALVQAGLALNSSVCPEYPSLPRFWQSMTLPLDALGSSLPGVVWDGIMQHGRNFLYRASYAIDYLPGVPANSRSAAVANLAIWYVVVAVVLLAAVAGAVLGARLLCQAGRPAWLDAPGPRQGPDAAFLVLLVGPVLALLAYDVMHNFYRAFTLNHLLAVALALLLAELPLGRLRPLALGHVALVALVALGSLGLNLRWFRPALVAGYQGPSLTLQRDWHATGQEVRALARRCGVDLRRGRIVIDDLSYDGLKHAPLTYPITYLMVQAEVTGLPMAEVLRRVGAAHALARCAALDGAGIPMSLRQGEFCCHAFGSAP